MKEEKNESGRHSTKVYATLHDAWRATNVTERRRRTTAVIHKACTERESDNTDGKCGYCEERKAYSQLMRIRSRDEHPHGCDQEAYDCLIAA